MGLLSFMFSSLSNFIGSSVALYLLGSYIYQRHLSPLRHVPGPWYAATTELWLASHIFRFRQARAIQELFEEYGPIVRIAPNKVVFCDATTNKRVYLSSRFNKSDFYKGFQANNVDHAMTTGPHAEHAPRRKAIAPHYSPSNAILFQPEIHKTVHELVDLLDKNNGKEYINVLHIFREMLVDLVCAASFSYDSGALKARATGNSEEHYLVRAVDDFPPRGIIKSLLPTPVWEKMADIPNDRWKLLYWSDKILADFMQDRVREMRAQMENGKLHEVEKIPLVQRLLEFRTNTGEAFPEANIVAEHTAHFVAGVDTSSTVLSYALWEISRRPDICRKVTAELDSAIPDGKTIPDISVLNSLPYFNAVIKETLRVHGSAPGVLERVVPEEGAELLGCQLPGGTIVGTQSWSVHRDPDVFPSPETFLPERWTDADAEALKDMEAHWMPFGSGIRICAGMPFAQQILRIALSTLVRNYDVRASPDTNDRSMRMCDAFVGFPKGGQVKLKLIPRRV